MLFDGDNDSLNAQFIWNKYSNKGAVIFNTELKICHQVYLLQDVFLFNPYEAILNAGCTLQNPQI